MVIDRSIINWDLVFNAKSYAEILNMLITNYRAIYGTDIDLYVNTADGEKIRMQAQFLYQFSQLGNDVYNSLDANNARGALLDNLMFLAGNLIRKTAAKTAMSGKLTYDGEDIDYDPTTSILLLQDNLNRMWRITPQNNVDQMIDGSLGVDIDLQCLIDGDYLLEDPILQLTHNGDFVSGSNVVVGAKIIVQRGSDDETDAQLRARKKETLAYNSTSLSDSIRDVVLNNIYSIQDIKIYNANKDDHKDEPSPRVRGLDIKLWNGSSIVNFTIPLHDVFVLVKPQEGVTIPERGIVSLALVDVLKRKITLGISTYQNADTFAPINQPALGVNYQEETIEVNPQFPGYTEIIRYYIAQPYSPAINIKVESMGAEFNLSNVQERVREALYLLARDYPINKDINIAEILNEVNAKGNLDSNNPTFRIDSIEVAGGQVVNNGYWYIDPMDMDDITVTEV